MLKASLLLVKPHEISSAVVDKIFYDGHLQMLTSQVMGQHEDDVEDDKHDQGGLDADHHDHMIVIFRLLIKARVAECQIVYTEKTLK